MKLEVSIRRAPIATGYRLEWWSLRGVDFFARMSSRDRKDWERIACRVEVAPNERIPKPKRALVYAVEEGRIRIAVPRRGEKPDPPHLVHLVEREDLFGAWPLSPTVDLRVDEASVDSLRPTRMWTVPAELFRQFLWERRSWKMPRSLGERYFSKLGFLARHLEGFSSPGVPIHLLWGRSANARIAQVLLWTFERGWKLDGNVSRIRERFTVAELARRAGVEAEWARRWVSYTQHEGVLAQRLGVWRIFRLWPLVRWAESRAWDVALDPPPDPVEQLEEGEVSLGRASREAEGISSPPDASPSSP